MHILRALFDAFGKIQERLKVVFPAHPRTLSMIEKFGMSDKVKAMHNLIFCPPLDYHQTLKLNANSRFVMTDSGGLQEETTALGIPCITIRENTERPVTVTVGTNELVGTSPEKLLQAVSRVLDGKWKQGALPSGWDGKASERIVAIMEAFLTGK